MNGKLMLYKDQWGNTWLVRTVKDLCEKLGYSKAQPMYVDKLSGESVKIGYVVGPHWLQAFQPWEG